MNDFLVEWCLLQELHSTRGVLAGERARAFQLQVTHIPLTQNI